MYSAEQIARALELHRLGWNYSRIARETGFSRPAIRSWVEGEVPCRGFARRRGSCLRCAGYRFPVPRISEFAYSHLLGLYLGDGSISAHPKGVYRLRVSLDRAYPVIVAECVASMGILMPENKISVVHATDGRMDEPSCYSRHWPCLFPQHGTGRKHEREIELEPWQREIADRYPWRLLRGLIQSDGCRSTNTIKHPKKTYRYPRYHFTNHSLDIQRLFCEYCDKVGVEWRQMNRWSISVARRESVSLMDRAIGPKR